MDTLLNLYRSSWDLFLPVGMLSLSYTARHWPKEKDKWLTAPPQSPLAQQLHRWLFLESPVWLLATVVVLASHWLAGLALVINAGADGFRLLALVLAIATASLGAAAALFPSRRLGQVALTGFALALLYNHLCCAYLFPPPSREFGAKNYLLLAALLGLFLRMDSGSEENADPTLLQLKPYGDAITIGSAALLVALELWQWW